MRVIAGALRGRALAAPKGSGTRPTPGRVKEALFSMLGEEVLDACVLDLFAGTGALGLEAISRGAASAVFVENDRQALKTLKGNIAALSAENSEVLAISASRALDLFARQKRSFDLAFLDPPYALDLLPTSLTRLAADALVRAGGTVVCEHYGKASPPQPPPGWRQQTSRRYGDVAITLFCAGKGSAS